MKVGTFREIFRLTQSLKPQGEGDGYGQQPGGEGSPRRQQTAQSPEDEAPAPTEPSIEEQLRAVQAAIEDFTRESKTQSHGLQASIRQPIPTGAPGLSVVLSDLDGRVIRSFSGAEFLKLRQAGSADTRGRGKLLDQKY